MLLIEHDVQNAQYMYINIKEKDVQCNDSCPLTICFRFIPVCHTLAFNM